MIRTLAAWLLALLVTSTTASLVWRWWWVDDDFATPGRQPRLDHAAPADDLGFSAALVAAGLVAAAWIVRELRRRAGEASWLRLAVFTALCVIPLQVVVLGLSGAG